jgi:transposase
VTHALHRAARQAQPTYAALCAAIRASPVVAPDETSWKVAGRLHWLWAFASPDTTIYAIRPGRGFPEAAAILGAEYSGVLVRDGWAPYRHFTHAAHQTCVAHLLRRCRDLGTDHPRAPFVARVHTILQQALTLRDRRNAGHVSAHGVAVARGRLMQQLLTTLDHPGPLPAMRRVAAHLHVEWLALFSFLFAADIDATNWRAEQALRPAVVTRKVAEGIGRPAARTPSKSSPASCARRGSAASTPATCSPTSSARRSPPSPKRCSIIRNRINPLVVSYPLARTTAL